jgi:hypothetical protein
MRRILLCLLFCLATAAHADLLRSPQVPVNGTGLQSLLNAQGQAIDVGAAQQVPPDFELANVGKPVTLNIIVHPIGSPADDLCLYFHFGGPNPALYTIAPGGMPPGGFSVVTYDPSQQRLNAFFYDQNGGGNTGYSYFHPPIAGMSFAILGANGRFYAFDLDNADHAAHILYYKGTGTHAFDGWICVENQTAAAGGDFDFDDDVYLVEHLAATPVQHTSWGTLKARFN